MKGKQSAVDNAMYDQSGHMWWDEDAGLEFATLRQCVNPVRNAYFSRTLAGLGISQGRVLDLGCGGGYLSEDFAKAGFSVTGLDPSARSLEAARAHALASGLDIEYVQGVGENLPCPDADFDIVACCDALEHVDDLDKVISECSRVLKPGGLFLFDTINRTLKSWLAVIFIAQTCPLTQYLPRRTHAWDKFIKPEELDRALAASNMACLEFQGFGIREQSLGSLLRALRARARGATGGEALLAQLMMEETNDLSISYMGIARKRERHAQR